MKLDKDKINWIKSNRVILSEILKERLDDYKNMVVDEPDLQKKEILSMFVKEFRLALQIIENYGKEKKEIKKPDQEYTGV